MLNKLFFEINMTWKRVIIFAVGIAIFTAAVLVIPFTVHTSLANIGTYIESWVLFALIIIINCKKPFEAGLKTFVFFLISQPLIYLFQVPFSSLGWQLFSFYPRWFVLTVLSLPGGMIAWYVKKDNILSSIILAVATGFIAYQGIYYLPSLINNFPHLLLSVVFCFGLDFVLIFTLLKNKTNEIVCTILTIIIAIVCMLIFG